MTTPSSQRPESTDAPTTERARSLSDQASATVRQAADVLEQELSAGLDEARRLQRKLTDQRRIEPGDLDEVSARVRGNAHLLIDMVSERFADLGSDDVQDLGERFAKDAHGAFDALLDLVQAAPELVNKLVEKAGTANPPAGDTTKKAAKTAAAVRTAKTAKAVRTAKTAKAVRTAKTAKAPGAQRAPRRPGS